MLLFDVEAFGNSISVHTVGDLHPCPGFERFLFGGNQQTKFQILTSQGILHFDESLICDWEITYLGKPYFRAIGKSPDGNMLEFKTLGRKGDTLIDSLGKKYRIEGIKVVEGSPNSHFQISSHNIEEFESRRNNRYDNAIRNYQLF